MEKKTFRQFKVKNLENFPNIGASSWGSAKSGKGFGIALRNKLEQIGIKCEEIERNIEIIKRGEVIELLDTNNISEINKLTGIPKTSLYLYKNAGELPKNTLQFYFDNQKKQCLQ